MLYNQQEELSPLQRSAAVAHRARLAKIAARAKPETPIVLPKFIEPKEVTPEPVQTVAEWVGRQKAVWFSVVEDLGPVVPPEPVRPNVESIQRAVARHLGVTRTDLLSARRTADIVRPRQIAMYLCRELTLRSMPEIGRRFGKRDHTTVLHGARKIKLLIESDKQLAEQIEAIKAELSA